MSVRVKLPASRVIAVLVGAVCLECF